MSEDAQHAAFYQDLTTVVTLLERWLGAWRTELDTRLDELTVRIERVEQAIQRKQGNDQ